MSNQYFNLYYSPGRQGYDTTTWRTLLGQPLVSNNRLVLSDAAILHYGDILRGDAVFNINIPAPAAGADRKFGFYFLGKGAYAYFNISGAALTATCSDGTTTTSSAITWQSAWTDTNTEFRVKWEAGTATFFVGGVQQAIIQDISVPGDPMSLYVSNNSNDALYLNYITVKTIQSYIMSEGNDDSSFELLAYESDQVNITESTTILIPTLMAPAAGSNPAVDSLTISESVTMLRFFPIDESDSVDITESVTVAMAAALAPNVNDTSNITEAVTVDTPA